MKTAFIFPGQGAQYVGMAKDFYDTFDECREVVDHAAKLLDFNVKGILFDENDLINKTEYTQAAMLVAEICVLEGVRRLGVQADVTAGLSLGEYSALVASGVMNFSDAVRLVRKRGIYMENAVPAGKGGMSAIIGLDAPNVEEICVDVTKKTGLCVVPANYNCPGQIVISGHKQAVDYAGERLKEAGARLVAPLNVSGPFHSPLLSVAGDRLRAELADVTLRDPVIPYVANVTAEEITSADGVKELLASQVSSPVRWEQSVHTMLDMGVTEFVEIGPGKTLSGFMKRIDRSIPVITVSTVADLDKLIKTGESNVGNEKFANA
ncbi:MAG: ACP S-malonyltransferase [Clostridia bacterium]|nr:ACP S-malonyltransferase [Clostridia bacterium]